MKRTNSIESTRVLHYILSYAKRDHVTVFYNEGILTCDRDFFIKRVLFKDLTYKN